VPTERHAIFLADLLQDVNILRPLIWLARRDLQMPVEILMSAKFVVRDTTGAWRQELETLAQELDARMHLFATEFEAYGLLEGKVGILVSASETDQSAHEVNHNVFRIAPSGFLRITVQHGFECIGFLPNREHIRAHGRNIKFAADVICGWSEANTLTAVSASERSKLFISGPPLLLGMAQLPRAAAHAPRDGMVCENLHSVRMRVSGNFQMSYMSTFFAFCEALDAEGNRVTLRPHPAGQYFQKNAIALPGNVDLENRPAYLVNFADYAFGISAPSSVIIDMLLAGIPTAI